MPEKLDSLSKTEWTVMNICWRKGEVSARVVYEESLETREREYQTIKTMLDRLVAKGYLRNRRFGPLLLYKPAVSRAKVLTQAIDNFVSTVLDDTLAPLFLHFVDRQNLSKEEVEALEKLIKKSKEK